MVARADDHGRAVQLRERAKHGRNDHPALLVELDLERVPVEEALQLPGTSVGERQRVDASGDVLPGGARMERQAAIEPLADQAAGCELRTESDGDGDAPLVVDRHSVLAGEHLAV